MLTRADLDEAVKGGIITQEQALALQELPVKRHAARHQHASSDERFVFMRNFNEFFIALGVVLLAAGLWFANRALFVPYDFPLNIDPPFITRAMFPAVFFAIMWGLAEYLTRRLKLTLPSIIIAILIVTLPFRYLMNNLMFEKGTILVPSIVATVFALTFYLRFRLPFTLLLIAGGSILILFTLVAENLNESNYGLFLLAGLATLAVAQWYDMSDRERLTRRSDCGFWLTLIAAPLIVHPIAGIISSGEGATAQSNILTIAVVILFALIALIIDRRAFLVSSLAYLGGAMIYAFTQLGGEQNALWITLLLMGASVILLGVGWHRARRAVMQFVPFSLARHLPVVRALMSNS